MDVAASVLAALVALHPGPGGTDESRRVAVDGIVAAARAAPLWERKDERTAGDSDSAPEVIATALLLAAIGQHESSFDPRVGDCRVRGGGAVTYYQLMGPWAYDGHRQSEVCASPALAAELALRVLRHHQKRCKRCTPAGWLAAYASGDPRRSSRASRDTARLFAQLARSVHLLSSAESEKPPRWEKGFPRDAP